MVDTISVTQTPLRQQLGNFSSIVCIKAILTGVEEALGEQAAAIALIAAGRQRGKSLAAEVNLAGKGTTISLEDITQQVRQVIGKDGTCLCLVDKILQSGDAYQVYVHETVELAGESKGSSRTCTYTLGAIQGFLEALFGQRLRGKQVQSVLRGDIHDVLEYTIVS